MPGRRRSGAWQTSIRWLGLCVLAVALLLGVRLAHALVARGATTVTLQLWPAGQGRIDVLQKGVKVSSCDFLDLIHHQSPCDVPVSAGAPVTVQAVPEPNAVLTTEDSADLPDFPVPDPTFVRWTVGACADAGDTCTFTPAGGSEWVGAIFTPLQLEVGIDRADGSLDSVQVDGQPTALTCDVRGFGVSTCHGRFPADSTISLVEAPGSGSPEFSWGDGCASQTADPPPARCTVEMTNIRTFVSAAYGDPSVFTPPDFPFKIEPHVRIERVGTGSGRVTGSGYDCGSLCSAFPDYQARLTLEAHAGGGSHFVRWIGVCSSAPICSFGAGSATVVLAQFDADTQITQPATQTQPKTQPEATVVSTPATTVESVPAGTVTAPTVTAETVLTTAAFAPRLVRLATARRAGHRVIVLTLESDRATSATVRVLRRGHALFSRVLALRAGRRVVQIRIPAAVAPGRCRISLRIASGLDVRTVTSFLRIGR